MATCATFGVEFAVKIFNNADKQDRAGRATADTAKAYYAASIFIEVRFLCTASVVSRQVFA
eukprot:2180245-Pyramimonas_sp.AAC.2